MSMVSKRTFPALTIRVLSVLVLVGTMAALTGCGAQQLTPEGSEISGMFTLMTWGGAYTDATVDAYLQPMQDEYGIEYQVVNAPSEMIAKLEAMVEADSATVDIIAFGALESFYSWDEGMLEPLPEDLKAECIEYCGEENVTDFAVMADIYGDIIACNAAEVEKCPTNAAEFWDVENFPGPRMMPLEDWYHVIPFALMADGVPADELFPLDWDRAFAKLDEIKPYINVWFTSGEQSQQVFRDGEVAIAYMWDGRAWGLIDQGFDMELSYDGATYAPLYFVIPKNPPNKPAAFEFLRWYASHPEAQAEWMTQIQYGTCNPDAYDLLDDDLKQRLVGAHLDEAVPIDFSHLVGQEEVRERWFTWVGE